jgi:uncharacterized membrane protein
MSRIIMLALMASSALGFLQQQGRQRASFSGRLNLFDKLFEEEGMLGKGITVGKVQVAMLSPDRSDSSIFYLLQACADDTGNEPEELSRMANDVCLALMRKSDDWLAACSTTQWFKGDDAGKAASYYNDLTNTEAMKFEKVGTGSDFR